MRAPPAVTFNMRRHTRVFRALRVAIAEVGMRSGHSMAMLKMRDARPEAEGAPRV